MKVTQMEVNRYRLHWYDGSTEEIEGFSIRDAFRQAGYGGRALRALDYWELISE